MHRHSVCMTHLREAGTTKHRLRAQRSFLCSIPREPPETTIPDVDTDTDLGRMIAAFYAVGVLCGTDEDGTFDGDRAITRAEEAVIFSRVLQKLGF